MIAVIMSLGVSNGSTNKPMLSVRQTKSRQPQAKWKRDFRVGHGPRPSPVDALPGGVTRALPSGVAVRSLCLQTFSVLDRCELTWSSQALSPPSCPFDPYFTGWEHGGLSAMTQSRSKSSLVAALELRRRQDPKPPSQSHPALPS